MGLGRPASFFALLVCYMPLACLELWESNQGLFAGIPLETRLVHTLLRLRALTAVHVRVLSMLPLRCQ